MCCDGVIVLCKSAAPFLADLFPCVFRAASAFRLGMGLDLFGSRRPSKEENISRFLGGCHNPSAIPRRAAAGSCSARGLGAPLPLRWGGWKGLAGLQELAGSEEKENKANKPFPLSLVS